MVLRQLGLVVATGSVAQREQSVASARDDFAVPSFKVSLLLLPTPQLLAWCAKNKRPWLGPFDDSRSEMLMGPSNSRHHISNEGRSDINARVQCLIESQGIASSPSNWNPSRTM